MNRQPLVTYHYVLISRLWSILLDLEVLEPLEGLFHFVIVDVLLAFSSELCSDRIQVRLETGEALLRLITAGWRRVGIRGTQFDEIRAQFLYALAKSLGCVRKNVERLSEIVGIGNLVQLLSGITNASDERVDRLSKIVACVRLD